MSGRTSAATERAIQRVLNGETRAAAARAEGITYATIHRAWKAFEQARQRAAQESLDKQYINTI